MTGSRPLTELEIQNVQLRLSISRNVTPQADWWGIIRSGAQQAIVDLIQWKR
ncbi:MAG: hypothetical protein ACE5NG_20970 [bacterium]